MKYITAVVIVLSLAFVGGVANKLAHADKDEIKLLKKMKITLVDAILAAEQDQQGTAIEASIDDDSFRPEYEVTIVRDNKEFDVQVDGVTGKVLSAREDKDD